jgi:glucose/arabinose dehydrogenase
MTLLKMLIYMLGFLIPVLTNIPAWGTALTTELVASGFSKPVYLTSPPDDSLRLFILEQHSGEVIIVRNDIVLSRPFLDIGNRISTSFERGLLSMAFHPDYQANGYFYVNYTNSSGDLVISRFQVSASDPDSADNSSEFILLTIDEPEANHNGGTLLFGPSDGYLYIGVGDGGGSGDNHGTIGHGQDSTTLLGTILRLDINSGSPYAIPPDNPFVGRSGRDEIWIYGLRNPWRMSFDRDTGDLYIADVGQGVWEEIDFQPTTSNGGENYGWRLMEGAHCFNPSSNCDPGGLVNPIAEYSHSDGCSITGGYIYRGCRIPDLRGTYFYSDWCNGRIWSFRYDGIALIDSTERTAELAPGGGRSIDNISSFGEDTQGELYIIDHADGEIYKIVPAEPVPSDCDQIGCCTTPGDANNDEFVNVGDAVLVINYVFRGGPAPICHASADANIDCTVNVGDAVYLISYIFKDGASPQCVNCA